MENKIDYKLSLSRVKREVWGETLGFLEKKEIFKVLNSCKLSRWCLDRAYVLKQKLEMILEFEKRKISWNDGVHCLYKMLPNFNTQSFDFSKEQEEEIIKYIIRNISGKSLEIQERHLIFDSIASS